MTGQLNDGTWLQVMREIDKLDKIGLDGVCEMLGNGRRDASGAFVKGVGLHPLQVGMIRLFFEESAAAEGDDNEVRLKNIEQAFRRLNQVRSRIDLMAALEERVVDSDGTTSWDRLLALRANDDETWRDGGRPANIGWALDDLVAALCQPSPPGGRT